MMPRKTTNDRSEILEIHVLGAGKGESIVLGWPDNRWGVIDCYTPSLQDKHSNPTLRFLSERGITELEFLCLTHPHDDHFRGMSQLVDNLSIKQFWRYPTLSQREFRDLIKLQLIEAERANDPEGRENGSELVYMLSRVEELRKSRQLKQKMASGKQQLYPTPLDDSAIFQVWSFAPTGDDMAEYESRLPNCFDESGLFRRDSAPVPHNEISVGLVVKFGKSRLILGGDLERKAWSRIVTENTVDLVAADMVKVSHHGSETGMIPGLWETFSSRKKPIAVLTAYNRFKLPNPRIMEWIRQHSSMLMVTCHTAFSPVDSLDARRRESREFLRRNRNARAVPPTQECGRCSLHFDTEGNCRWNDCHGPAWWFNC